MTHTPAQALAAYARQDRADAVATQIAEVAADLGCLILEAAEKVDGRLRVSPDTLDALRGEVRPPFGEDDSAWGEVVTSALAQIRRTQPIDVLPADA
jgi:hypothetical protein